MSKKLKNMPTNPAEVCTTTQLVQHLKGIITLETLEAEVITDEQVIDELYDRLEGVNDQAVPEAYRGGIRPTHAPTH